MRRAVPACVLVVVVFALLPSDAQAHHPAKACAKAYSAKQEFRALRAVFRDPSKVTKAERRKLARFRGCARSHRIARRTVRRLHWWQEWRASYKGYWRLAAERLGDKPHGALASLRACESTSTYGYNGSSGYDGAYQYDVRTWYEAQAWRGTPGRHYTSAAWAASVDQQDVVTYAFYYSHRSRWPNCSA